MKIGLIDVDNWGKLKNCFPNLALMKISAFCKQNGCYVEWYNPKIYYDYVFMSKVFSFSIEPFEQINSDHIIRGGYWLSHTFKCR